MSTPDIPRLAEGLREHTAAMAAAVAGRDPAAPVPTCPEWRLRDLVGHVGQAHRWAAGLVLTGEAAPTPDPAHADPGPVGDWPGWLRGGADDLAAAVEKRGPETVVRGPIGPLPAAFWLRRMLHDTSVHHADAALAVGVPFAIAPDLAADAISEGLELMTSPHAVKIKPGLAALRGRGETLYLRADDVEGPGWLLTREPDGPRCERSDGEAAVSACAPARDLLLMLTRRLSPEDAGAVITGERAVLDHWLANTAF
ncbi:maleylpyruvate isomerase family mycothiol-dependent enzyme [Actinomadura graeca]|uniref:Maleylpyruvate isomerase family mycothiol-dependent enzyme n=1 Tax=Actinomadura graeca TaxID=2750812 RepID=A0ABX8QQQ6_9ACTN|nr:maleylpyruvate isomerase family mycothiol-dependent enzyme [Actinomadura graeca]QXJ20274.1 maleylpyruvate isomerase family mycothiol-dependent enzyme [Actinomadura graeca]